MPILAVDVTALGASFRLVHYHNCRLNTKTVGFYRTHQVSNGSVGNRICGNIYVAASSEHFDYQILAL